jgi:outer membrane murein-binding lipoprotein Lpp
MRPLAALTLAAALAGCGATALAGCGTTSTVTTGRSTSGNPTNHAAPRIHATCPRSDRSKPVSRAASARASLVPDHPNALLLCRYSGLNGHPRLALISSKVLTDAATVERLAHELDALRPTSGAVNCPADFGDAVIAFFEYPTAPPNPVTVGLSGCKDASNGHITRLTVFGGSQVATQLEALARG